MNRRAFLTLCTVLLTSNISANIKDVTPWDIINSTLSHLFPKTNRFDGSEVIGLDKFLILISSDQYFDKNDLEFLSFGAKKLFEREKNFLSIGKNQKERALREFEKEYQNWLSLLMYYGFEGMLGDPIYGGNTHLLGYKALEHNAGIPRPKSKYGKANV